jgi:hypothetical protein
MLGQGGYDERRVNDLNQRPLGPKPSGADFQVVAESQDTSTEDSRCTTGCTSSPETVSDVAAQLADLIAKLTPSERARIAAMLVGEIDRG